MVKGLYKVRKTKGLPCRELCNESWLELTPLLFKLQSKSFITFQLHRGACGTVASESALRSARTLLSRVRAPALGRGLTEVPKA
ncbi:hypothetical protein PoB_004453500 [Plakobranchus ocellatus]|uniref:Uncharacterized protein n=1 Tax=Plakobranchus ocellatus TaxID=259542 RepID=A0AAV4BG03_9GAST|nr:hypothetical protein PoB_004453500 [Plakobranchus ocellatus]